MSHQVQIDYQGIAIQCQSVCEVAESRLKELDKLLADLKETSTSLMGDKATELVQIIESERLELASQIDIVRGQANAQAHSRNNAIGATLTNAKALQKAADKLSSERLIEFQSLLTSLLGESINESYRKMRERNNGVITIDGATQTALDGIEDAVLRQFTYLAYLHDNTLTGKNLIAAGMALKEKSLNSTYESHYAEEEQKIRAELEAAKVGKEVINKVISGDKNGSAQEKLSVMREAATQEIVCEKVRQKSLRIIMKAIQERGFIVDKKNIKIKRETNEVVMVALKASGEKAEFRVFLDGKFVYDFRGYEGQACQKDIQPFMDDLEEVYGIHVTKQTEIWSNPDKNSTMKYQAINTNKNKQ